MSLPDNPMPSSVPTVDQTLVLPDGRRLGCPLGGARGHSGAAGGHLPRFAAVLPGPARDGRGRRAPGHRGPTRLWPLRS